MLLSHTAAEMSVYETSPVQQTDESETTITLVFPNTTYIIRPVNERDVRRGPVQEMGPSDPSELVVSMDT